MNKLELFVYNLVKNNPRLKSQLRDLYQSVCDFIPVKRFESAYAIEVREGFFYGFHDKCPWSADNTMLLAHRVTVPLRMPQPDDTMEVGYFSGPNYANFRIVGSTRAWNWHQGSMLQWIGTSSRIAFNDFDGSRLITRIVDLDGKPVTRLSLPITALDANGTKALSYNLPRLQKTPHKYGYANGSDPDHDRLIPSKHGIHLIDLASGQTNLLFSVAGIAQIDPEPSMQGAFHHFSHCQFSPSGGRFAFYHRWSRETGKLFTRMISCDLEGNNIHVFPTSDMVSHFAWQDDQHILAYARTRAFDDGYYLFKDKTNEFVLVGQGSLVSDGHPSFSKDRKWFVTDTYPDRFRLSYLILYNLENNKRYNLARLYAGREYALINPEIDLRCDLHPRWNRDDTMICFDSAHTGKRALCTITLGDLSKEGEPLSL